MELGVKTLQNLINLSENGKTIKVPQYDKSKFGGRGDRATEDKWKDIEGKIDLVIVEGWMLGYKSVKENDPTLVSYGEHMQLLNTKLVEYEKLWYPFFDASIIVGVANKDIVFKWREQAEIDQRRSKGLPSLDSE